MKVYKCPRCQSSNAETLCRVNDRIEFHCRMCKNWFSVKDEPVVKESKKADILNTITRTSK